MTKGEGAEEEQTTDTEGAKGGWVAPNQEGVEEQQNCQARGQPSGKLVW